MQEAKSAHSVEQPVIINFISYVLKNVNDKMKKRAKKSGNNAAENRWRQCPKIIFIAVIQMLLIV